MTIEFSKQWWHYSESSNGIMNQESEKALIEQMILRSESIRVRLFAESQDGLGVYVRTGLHTSKTEPRVHVQAVLGSTDPEAWKRTKQDSGFTAHILHHDTKGNLTDTFVTYLYDGQPHLKRVGAD